ncbi:MAG: hypothetical protein R6V36_06690 [Psychroflexus sp.]
MASIKRSHILLLSVPFLLLIPFIGMQISDEVNWSTFDFLVMGVLLIMLALSIELTLRIFKSNKARLIFIGLILFLFFLIWAELAVGVFGTPFAGN